MTDRLAESAFLRACRGAATPYTPVWLNRQAGRYMKEYHQVKGNTPSLDFFKTPELAARVTCDAQRILGVDAAIMFADLLPVLEPMGLQLDYLPGLGPKFANPIRSGGAVDALQVVAAREGTPYIAETVRLIRRELPGDIPLIGFAGAPFTLASYAIEGQSSKDYLHVKRLMYGDPGAWRALLEKLVVQVADYVNLQIRWRAGRADLRFVDRLPFFGRLSRVRAAADSATDGGHYGPRAHHLFRYRQRAFGRGDVRDRPRPHGAGLAHAARPDLGRARQRRRAGQSRPDRAVRGCSNR